MSRWLAALAIFVVTWSTTHQVQARISMFFNVKPYLCIRGTWGGRTVFACQNAAFIRRTRCECGAVKTPSWHFIACRRELTGVFLQNNTLLLWDSTDYRSVVSPFVCWKRQNITTRCLFCMECSTPAWWKENKRWKKDTEKQPFYSFMLQKCLSYGNKTRHSTLILTEEWLSYSFSDSGSLRHPE